MINQLIFQRSGERFRAEYTKDRTTTVDAIYVNVAYNVTDVLASVLNNSCQGLSKDQLFQWPQNSK